ncbi:MAG: CGLD27 family protein [Spirulina sp. SIO3F2]|nr:CGLD27 family protein [Spirulina sp. SIO3F2]
MTHPPQPQPQPTFCPVPIEQQPLQEYEAIKVAWLFTWPVQSVAFYSRKLAWVGLWSGLVLAPLVAASFPLGKAPVQFACFTLVAALAMVVLLVLRLYLGWRYVRDRLQQETVSYEESGWYDGQTWTKPPEVLARDRLVVTYQVQPVLGRLLRTMVICGLLMGLGSLIGGWIA